MIPRRHPPTCPARAAPSALSRHPSHATTPGGHPRGTGPAQRHLHQRRPQAARDFWAAATGYTQRRDRAEEVLLAPDDWSFPRLNFQHGATPPSGPGRVHLDLTTADRAAEVDRLIGLGATKLWTIDVAQSGTTTWTTMRDPDGNEFCVVQ